MDFAMKVIVPFLFVLLPVVSSAAHWSAYDGKFECPEIRNSHLCAKAIEENLGLDFIHGSDDGSLAVTLLNGNAITLQHEFTIHMVLEYLKSRELLVIYSQYYEGGGYGFLNRRNGKYIPLKGYPLFSPSGKYVVVTHRDLDAGYSPNVLEIYGYNNDDLSLEYVARTDDWGPDNVTWDKSDKLYYDAATFECSIEQVKKCRREYLHKKVGVWERKLN